LSLTFFHSLGVDRRSFNFNLPTVCPPLGKEQQKGTTQMKLQLFHVKNKQLKVRSLLSFIFWVRMVEFFPDHKL